MGVYAADFAKKMFCRFCIELIEAKKLGPLDDFDSREGNRGCNGSSSATKRAIAAPHVDEPIRQIQFELNATAVTFGSVLWLNNYAINFFDIQWHLAASFEASNSHSGAKTTGFMPIINTNTEQLNINRLIT